MTAWPKYEELELGDIAKELETKVIMMGRIDKPDYWAKCMEYKEQMDVRFDTSDEKIKWYG